MAVKRTVSMIALLLALATLFSCTPIRKEKSKSESKPTSTPSISVSMVQNTGFIQAGTVHTVGLSLSGMLYVAGHSTHGQLDARNTGNIAQVVSSKNTIAALRTNGSIAIFGDTEQYNDALLWTGIVKIAMSDDHLVALTDRGLLLACGNNSKGQCDVSEFNRVVDIDAANGYTMALTDSGNVLVTGEYPTFNNIDETDENGLHTYSFGNMKILSIAACQGFMAVLVSDGGLILTGDVPEETWTGANQIYSAVDHVYSSDSGSFLIYPECDDLSEFENTDDIIHIAFGDKHTAVMHKDGTVECVGDDDDKQCDTEYWDLLTHVDEYGYVTGFAPNTDISFASEIMSDELSGDVTFFDDGKKVSSGTVCTGMTIELDGESLGEVIIYGDIDSDGDITEADLDLLKAHIEGTKELSGTALLAADVLHYTGETKAMDDRHIEAYKEYLSGTGSIAQYVMNPYREKVADKYAINSDVAGWIEIQNTNIDHPLVYGSNYYYHEHDIYKEYSKAGCIYPLYEARFKVNAIAGHNMRKTGTMFHQLHRIQNNAEDLLTYKNRVFGIQLYEGYTEWEVFALYETEADEPTDTILYNMNRMFDFTDDQKQEWIDTQLRRSEIDLGVDVSIDDTFLFVYTCGDYYEYDRDNQARLYIFMRQVG